MGNSPTAYIIFLIVVLQLVISSKAGEEGSCPLEECPNECGRRCELASAYDTCIKYCYICCIKCLCVPSGTYGHKEECPCYNNWKTRKGTSKCP
ncbi:peamaclein-like [Chenopodium quinoa]|uniref:peamaclein-like n=1 Tax=Chenopodium quinoa TaxID=63459 RepID=UPI000B77915A|nr:peamaclein-like [Chenopodium quinoa]